MAIDQAVEYAIDALRASGFVVLHCRVAVDLRSDLWRDEPIAAAQLRNPVFMSKVTTMPGVQVAAARLRGIDQDVQVLSRSQARLAERVEWVTGRECTLLPEGGTPARKSGWTAPRPTAAVAVRVGDLYHDVATSIQPLTCSGCKKLVDGACTDPAASGIRFPVIDVRRRCPAYLLPHNAMKRTGAELWPELAGLPRREATRTE